MPVSQNKIKEISEEIEQTLVPSMLLPLVTPPERGYNPSGGRPKKEPLAKVADKMAMGRDYYLANAFNILLRNVAYELPCSCEQDCPYEAACFLPERDRPRSQYDLDEVTPEDAREHLRCPIEFDLIMTSFYGYLAELHIDETRPTEVQTAAKLAALQVYQRRIDCLINGQGMVVEEGIPTRGGDIALTHAKHPLWDVRKDLERREEAILKQFHATREQAERNRREEMAGGKRSVAEWLASVQIIDAEEVSS